MKKLVNLLFTLFCISLSSIMHAQNNDSKYLTGAVPETDGKVVFSKEFSIPNMSQDEIYERLSEWLDARLKKNENNSRIVYSDKEKGQIVGTGDEWIVFSSSALSLDRTRILYQVTINCAPETCIIEVSKIRYIYREGDEKYTAEEWIVDKYALNKSKTKLVRGLAKWRRKTVDFMDTFFMEAAEALSTNKFDAQTNNDTPNKPQKTENAETKSFANSGPTVIIPKKKVITNGDMSQETVSKAENEETDGMEKAADTVIPTTAIPDQSQEYNEISPDELTSDDIQTNEGKLVIVIGDDPFNVIMMTANAGGSLGRVNNKPVVFTILSPEQSYEQMEKAEYYTVRFYPNGTNEPSLILECKRLPAPAAMEGMPRTYVGEIIKAISK